MVVRIVRHQTIDGTQTWNGKYRDGTQKNKHRNRHRENKIESHG
jgi:hypothetical protein